MAKDEERYLDTVAKNIVRLRKQKGVTQEQLAELTGMDTVSIGYIEQGKRDQLSEPCTDSLKHSEYQLLR